MLLCHIPDYCYHQQELPKLTCLIGNNSASFLYSHRRILIELEYIQIRQSGSLRNRLTEYRLVPLYDVGTSNNSQNDEEIYADDEIPQYEGVPADGTHHGTPTASQPLLCKLPNIFFAYNRCSIDYMFGKWYNSCKISISKWWIWLILPQHLPQILNRKIFSFNMTRASKRFWQINLYWHGFSNSRLTSCLHYHCSK